MFKIKYLQKASGCVVLVLVAANDERDARDLVQESDSEFKEIVECRRLINEVWFVRTEPAN